MLRVLDGSPRSGDPLRGHRHPREGWERAALDELRHGEPAAALAAYDAYGRVHLLPTSARHRRLAAVCRRGRTRDGRGRRSGCMR